MAVLYNFEIKLNRLFGGVGCFRGAQRWLLYPPSFCVLSWGVESPTPQSCLSRRETRGQAVRREALVSHWRAEQGNQITR